MQHVAARGVHAEELLDDEPHVEGEPAGADVHVEPLLPTSSSLPSR
jgi:hypothetical protein